MNYLPSLNILFLDLEVKPATPSDPEKDHIFKIGALLVQDSFQVGEKRQTFEKNVRNREELAFTLKEIDQWSEKADYLVGHNIIDHDLAILKAQFPTLALYELKVIDTLLLSPIAFPKNPYHRLLKDYKLIRSALSSPLKDCESNYELLKEQLEGFLDIQVRQPALLLCYQSILGKSKTNYGELLALMTGSSSLSMSTLYACIAEVLKNDDATIPITHKACLSNLKKLIVEETFQNERTLYAFLYTLAWLTVSGGNSVLAPWVHYRFPETIKTVLQLRDRSCGDISCGYCGQIHDARKELKRFFPKMNDFRYEDLKNNLSIQRDIVELGMAQKNILAILPTGGGKSLCYQLPALNRYYKDGSLTIIISPLQSLMKDQVDGLEAKGIHCVASLNGLLTLPERALVLEKIQMGDIGILLVAPEQFRSKSFKSAIAHRKIGSWVYDEAHCLSKWGSDFRPDYLYVAKCIKLMADGRALAPISCFTATAKQSVITDIKNHFKNILDIDFNERISHKERENLTYEVLASEKHEKIAHMEEYLKSYLKDGGGAIVFVAKRKSAEEYANLLAARGFNCKSFHAGMTPTDKKEIQADFIAGNIDIIVSTNAFGMGVDKPDVRLVIHADIPGSLENYLQEAGRAGRDNQPAHCVLLYEPIDLEVQFRLTEFSKLTFKDIYEIYKKIRAEQQKRGREQLIISAGEILKDAMVESFDIEDDQAKTKVNAAIAWLERSEDPEYLYRTDNIVRVFPGHMIKSLEIANEIIDQQKLSIRRKQEFKAIVQYFEDMPSDQLVDTDKLASLIAGSIEDVASILQELETLEILSNKTLLTSYIRYGIEDSSLRRLDFIYLCTKEMIHELRELVADLEVNQGYPLNLIQLSSHLNDQNNLRESSLLRNKETIVGADLIESLYNSFLVKGKVLPEQAGSILKSLSNVFDAYHDVTKSSQVKVARCLEISSSQMNNILMLKAHHYTTWDEIISGINYCYLIGEKILQHFIDKRDGKTGKNLLIETTFEEIQNIVFENQALLDIVPNVDHQKKVIQRVLLYLHHNDIITLNHGMTVMRTAVTLVVNTEIQNRYLKTSYQDLMTHYKERRSQIHVMGEFAKLGLQDINHAMRFTSDYFNMPEQEFIKRYFEGREDVLSLATSKESWDDIIDELNPIQRKIVESGDNNQLVLAGPGSGKTRVIVRRIGYLLRVQRVLPKSIIVLTYNRSAANEIREQLYNLVGNESYGITVMTYHSIAMRLTGTVYKNDQSDQTTEEIQQGFKLILENAIALLEDKPAITLTGEESEDDDQHSEDAIRMKLLRGYQYILIDEYQDIDEDQYTLISALAGRTNQDEDEKLSILAVGDDDQNIYTFRGTSNEYIDRFKQDYNAKVDYLVENYRSSQAIINASNDVIQYNENRLKQQHPIVINQERKDAPLGGEWTKLDSKREGRVLTVYLPDQSYERQAFYVLLELKRLYDITPSIVESCAILSKQHDVLECFVGGLKDLKYPFYYENDKQKNFHTSTHRYFKQFIRMLEEIPTIVNSSELNHQLRIDHYPNKWYSYFTRMLEQISIEFNELDLHTSQLIQWCYEYAHEVPIIERKGIYLGTIHSAKGLEFDHVFLLDDMGYISKNIQAIEEARRLYYVGMTRAKSTLTMFSFKENHLFNQVIKDTIRTTYDRKYNTSKLIERHLLLAPSDIYLDFLSTKQAEDGLEHASALQEGDELKLVFDSVAKQIYFCTSDGIRVARSSASFMQKEYDFLKSQKQISCFVHSLIMRQKSSIKNESFRNRCATDNWEIVQPMIVTYSVVSDEF